MIIGQPIRHRIVTNMPVLQAGHTAARGAPKGTVARGSDAAHDLAQETLRLRILGKASAVQAENAATIGPNPQVVARVFGQTPHTTIGEAVLFVEGFEAPSIKPR